MPFEYPEFKEDTIVDDYHGTKVPDRFRWLEDPDSEETKKFVDAQNEITMPYIKSWPHRERLEKVLTEKWDYPKYSAPFKKGPRYFYYYNTGLQNQSVLFVQDDLKADARVFLDPNKLSEDGTTALRTTAFSDDGEYYAYGISDKGSDWVTIKFKKVAENQDLPDVLNNVKFTSLSWTHDNKGVFYNQYPKHEGKSDGTETTQNVDQKLYYHKLGTDQSEDILCVEFPENPKWMIGAEVTDCGKYLVINISESCERVNRVYYVDLKALPDGINGLLPYVKVVDNFDAEYDYITNEDTIFTFKTNKDAPRYKIIKIDLSKPDEANWELLIDQHDVDVLDWCACVNKDKLVLCYLQDVKNTLYLYNLNSGERITTFPLDVGTIMGYSGNKKDTDVFYKFVSYLTPTVIYRCNLSDPDLKPEIFKKIDVKGFDPEKFTVSQIFFQSKDGTKVPMFIVHRKDIKYDGSNPVLLYGYGGFSVPITPSYSVTYITFLQHLGGVVAVANIRGGGEYGEAWHKDGIIDKKQNVFDDFHAAAEYLIENKYTSKKYLAIEGGSNGGLLVGACLNQRPDLYGLGIAHVGVMDMLRFHKFTIGHAWVSDFGCSDKLEEFKHLIKYSPLHNIKVPEGDGVQYPCVLLLTADHDDRVVPLHSLKFMAELQRVCGKSPKQTNPMMIRIDTKSGHGFGKPTAKVIEEKADIYSFMALCMDLKWQD